MNGGRIIGGSTIGSSTIGSSVTLGILGGGQLARMTADAAHRLGLRVAIVEKTAGSPAGQVTPLEFVADWNEPRALTAFAAACDVITLESEFIDWHVLEALQALGKPVLPSAATIAEIQDKLAQKQLLANAGLPVPAFAPVESVAQARACGERFGYPFLLKARRNAYDGYGNRTVGSPQALEPAMAELGFPARELYAEAFVDFQAELATQVVRGRDGVCAAYPVVETRQERHICKWVLAPARVPPAVSGQAAALAREAVVALQGVGSFGVELFLTRGGQVLVNELAPRPHNSGHYTIEGARTSQFENHVRAVLGWPLGDCSLTAPTVVMVNLLGRRDGPASLADLPRALAYPQAKLHVYGKAETRVGRKMGHVTVLGTDPEECLRVGLAVDQALTL